MFSALSLEHKGRIYLPVEGVHEHLQVINAGTNLAK